MTTANQQNQQWDEELHLRNDGKENEESVVFSSSQAENIEKVSKNATARTAARKSKDLLSAYIYLILFFGSFFACCYFIVNRKQWYRIDMVDSWGNKCGVPNVAIDGVPQSGRNMTEQRYTFFFSTISLKKVVQPKMRADQHYIRLCVKKCPDAAISCNQFVQENGYASIQSTIDTYNLCEAYQKTILPFETGSYTCVPKIIHTMHGTDMTFESEFSRGFHKMTVKTMANFDRLLYNLYKLLGFVFLGFAVSYGFMLLLRFYPYLALYYIYFVSIHAALFNSIICWFRVFFIDKGEDPSDADIKEFLDTHQKKPVSAYGGSGSYEVTTTNSVDEVYAIAASVDRDAYIFVGAYSLGICLLLCWNAFKNLRPHKVKVIVLILQSINYTLPKAPVIFMIPMLCIWPHLLIFQFWSILSYFIYLPKRLWKDEVSGLVILDSEKPFWQSALLGVMTYLFWWVVGVAHSCQSFFTIGCMSELYFSEDGLKDQVKKIDISYGRWIRRVYYMFGQICAFTMIKTFGGIIKILVKVVKKLKLPLDFIPKIFAATCCQDCSAGDWEPLLEFEPRALVAVVIFGDSFYVAVRRTNLLLQRRGENYKPNIVVFTTLMAVVRFGASSIVLLFALITELPPVSFGEYDSLAVPYLLTFLITKTIAKIVMNTIMALGDSIFLCYCIDMEVNNGKQYPYFTPPVYHKLIALIKEENQEEDKEEAIKQEEKALKKEEKEKIKAEAPKKRKLAGFFSRKKKDKPVQK